MNSVIPLLLVVVFCVFTIFVEADDQSPDAWREARWNRFSLLSKEEIDPYIQPLIEYNLSGAIIIVLVDGSGYTWYPYGVLGTGTPPDNLTIFEIGSISKVITGLVMADAVKRGIYTLSAPVNTWLPEEYQLPDREGSEITGTDLVTHRSGLPVVPAIFEEIDPEAPWADQLEESMAYYETIPAGETYQQVKTTSLLFTPGTGYLYSNLGAAIAGDIISRAESRSYADLVAERVCAPLGMTSTGTSWSTADLTRRAPGFRAYAYPRDEARVIRFNEFWTACGGIHSDADDMAVFLAAAMNLTDTPLNDAMAYSQVSRSVTSYEPILFEQGMFWDIVHQPDGSVIYKKAGETNAHQAVIAFDPGIPAGVVILSDTAGVSGIHVEEEALALLERMQIKRETGDMTSGTGPVPNKKEIRYTGASLTEAVGYTGGGMVFR